MPILKNITRRNLIPTIDFEEFNQTERRSKSQAKPTPLTFLMVYLADTLHNLDKTFISKKDSHAPTLFKIPHN